MFEYELNSKVVAVDSVARAVENASMCILAIPTQMVFNVITYYVLICTLVRYKMHF